VFSSCLVHLDFWQSQWFKVSLPLIIFAVLFACSYIIQLYRSYKNPLEYHNQSTANPFERTIYFFSYGIVRLATYILMVGLAPFRCFQQADGTHTLVPSPNLNCYDSQWFSNMFLISLGILEIFLLPLGLLWLFVHYQNRFHNNKFNWKFGHLIAKFKENYYWWELVEMLKKLTFVIVVDLSNDLEKHFRAFLAESVLVVGLLLECHFHPRKDERNVTYIL
jgi:hypothetical protein